MKLFIYRSLLYHAVVHMLFLLSTQAVSSGQHKQHVLIYVPVCA